MHNLPLTSDLLAPAVALWNRCLGAQFPMRPALLQQTFWEEPNFDAEGSRAVLDGDRLVGLVGVKRRQVALGNEPADNRGNISAILVDPDYQGRGMGSGLLQEARAHLRRFSGEAVSLGADTGHLFPGIPLECRQALDWFARRGARLGGPVCDLSSLDLAHYQHPAEAQACFDRSPSVAYRPATQADVEGLRAFMAVDFPGRWAWEIEQHLTRGGRLEDVMIAVEAGQVLGFARIHSPESTRFGPALYWAPLFPGRHGGLGPIGVSQAQRGRGIGLGLLSASLAELRDRGVESGVIDWTGLVQFYGLVGFHPWKWYTSSSLPPLPA